FVPPLEPTKFIQKLRKSLIGHPEWTLVFDTETRTDAAQRLRFGTYQVYQHDVLRECGIFYDPNSLNGRELALLREWANSKQLKFMTMAEFVDNVFYGIGYDLRAAIVGFNLPFDISRLAIRYNSARGKAMRGGFTFQLSADPWRPRVQIKHLSAR